MPWRCGWKLKLARACIPPPEEDSCSVDFAINTINRAYPGCTGMYLGMAGHMLAFYGKKMNPRAGLLLGQAVTASKAIANIPIWMGYFARWRVRCVSISKASKILVGCKRIEKENLRPARWELQNQFSSMQLDYSLCYCSTILTPGRSSLPKRMRHPEPTLFDMDWQGVFLLRVLLPTHLWEGHFQAIANPLMMTEYQRIRPSLMDPPEGGVGAEEAEVAGVVVTLMGPAPLEGDVRKRMDFQVKSRFWNLEARRAMLMMWLAPLGSGPTVSRTIVITMRIHTSCPW